MFVGGARSLVKLPKPTARPLKEQGLNWALFEWILVRLHNPSKRPAKVNIWWVKKNRHCMGQWVSIPMRLSPKKCHWLEIAPLFSSRVLHCNGTQRRKTALRCPKLRFSMALKINKNWDQLLAHVFQQPLPPFPLCCFFF